MITCTIQIEYVDDHLRINVKSDNKGTDTERLIAGVYDMCMDTITNYIIEQAGNGLEIKGKDAQVLIDQAMAQLNLKTKLRQAE